MEPFLSTTITLFFILDPLGNVPVFLSVLQNVPEERRKKVILRELLIALCVLMFFLFLGNYIMSILHLNQESISVGGGVILFIIALKMIFPQEQVHHKNDSISEDPFIVPLAIPLVAGPSALAVIMLLQKSHLYSTATNALSLLCAWFVGSLILYNSTYFFKVLKLRGLIAMERLMGMLLVILSIQMLLDGLVQTFSKIVH